MIPAIQTPPISTSYVATLGFGYTDFRNRLRNANFAINQRNVSGTVTLAAGAYGHDGVKGGASGCTYTFATTGLDTTITTSAGTFIMPIEAVLIEGGAYILSWSGTAQARIWQGTGTTGSGSYASSPIRVTGLSANTQTNVEFSAGSVLLPQFEWATTATSFDRRPPSVELQICQRYYWVLPTYSGVFYLYAVRCNGSDTSRNLTISYPVTMRATPTVVITLSSGVTPSVGPSTQAVNIQATESSSASVDTVTLLTSSAEI